MIDASVVTRFVDHLHRAFHDGDRHAATKTEEAENVRLLCEQYRAIGRGDYAAALDLMADDMVLEITGPPGHPFVGRAAGRAEVGAALGRNFALVGEQQIDVLSLVAQGDTVVVVGQERGRYQPSGEPYSVRWVQIFVFRDGKLQVMREVFGVGESRGA